MSPATHFLFGWTIANTAKIEKRDRFLVTLAGVIPDADGLGIIVDYFAPRPAEPYFWYGELHHLMGHNLTFGLAFVAITACFAKRRFLTMMLAGISFHLHLFCDVLGSGAQGGGRWPMPYLWPFSDAWVLDWTGQWALTAWPNIVITLVLLILTGFLAWKRGFSPLEIFSRKADGGFVRALRGRFGNPKTKHGS
ncbi:MAG: inner membrane protein [Verrucomicrobiales bacterium]|jgi:inner membrane protein